MIISNFDAFQKANQSGSELDNIRIKNFNIFQKKRFSIQKRGKLEVYRFKNNTI